MQAGFVLVLFLLVQLSLLASATNQAALAPVSLTNADGQDLTLVETQFKVAFHGPLALVEVVMGFKNPYDRFSFLVVH